MLDRSKSMAATVADGSTTKWQAVTGAIATFLDDPLSAGLGLGLQYFPLLQPNVPATCTSSDECGGFGPCVGVCYNLLPGQRVPCMDHGQCGPGGECQVLATCSGDPETTCTNPGGDCAGGLGVCAHVPSYCASGTTCDASPYGEPAVAITALPEGAGELKDSIAGTELVGDTPTRVALQGAISQASAHAAANPERRVAVLFATDGLPTQCAPMAAEDIVATARAGQAAEPSVRTFTVGVFASDRARDGAALLDVVAEAGGTDRAIIVDTSQDVAAQFLAALNQVRQAALSCELEVPSAEPGKFLDYFQVNVSLTAPPEPSASLPYVGSADQCDTTGGWYYDVDPMVGDKPERITLCPSSCDDLRGAVGATLDVRLGCQTIVKGPR